MEKASRRTRAESNAANRGAVLDAAWKVFCDLGYGAAGLDRIAEVAGFSKGVVYSRFGSKADLFLALLERRIDERARANAAEAAVTVAGGGDVFAVLASRMVAQAEADHGWRLALVEFRLATARDPQLRERYAALHRDTVDRLAELLDSLAGPVDRPRGLPARSLAVAVLALDIGTMLEELAGGSLPESHRAELVRRLLGASVGSVA